MPPTPCNAARHLVGRHLADQQEQCGVARLQGLRRLFHEIVVDPDIGEGAAERPAGGAERSADQRHKEDHADQCAPECAGYSPGRRRMEQLVELEPNSWRVYSATPKNSLRGVRRRRGRTLTASFDCRRQCQPPCGVPIELASSSIFGIERSAPRPPLGAARHRRVIDRLHVDAVALYRLVAGGPARLLRMPHSSTTP